MAAAPLPLRIKANADPAGLSPPLSLSRVLSAWLEMGLPSSLPSSSSIVLLATLTGTTQVAVVAGTTMLGNTSSRPDRS